MLTPLPLFHMNTQAVTAIHPVPAGFVTAQIDAVERFGLPLLSRTRFVRAGLRTHEPGDILLPEGYRAEVVAIGFNVLKGCPWGWSRLIDVREDDEWRAGHAQGAEHMGRGIIERDIEQKAPDKEAELILYCGGGYRSALAADNLQRMGYTNVYSLAGGWKAWQDAGAPTEDER